MTILCHADSVVAEILGNFLQFGNRWVQRSLCSVRVKLPCAKRRPSLWDDDMIYSPTKYRETEGTKVC